jgi:structural maintenance of chromosome 2
LTRQANELRNRVKGLDFTYTDPTPNFDRSKVKGLIAQLFTLDESKEIAAVALEVLAGGRLYNVVVDTSATGTQLLKNGRLTRRVTAIPLDKIQAFRASADVSIFPLIWRG